MAAAPPKKTCVPIEERPTIGDLMRCSTYVDKRCIRQLGSHLKLGAKELDAIDKDYGGDAKLCAVFHLWLTQNRAASRKDVLNALRLIDEKKYDKIWKEGIKLSSV